MKKRTISHILLSQEMSCEIIHFSSVAQSWLTLRPHRLQHATLPCPPTPRACWNSCIWSRWCHPSHPLSSPSPPAFNLSHHQGLFQWVISSHQFSSGESVSRVWLLRPHGLQHPRPPCPSPTPGVYSNSGPLSRWCHPTISSSVVPFSQLQSFPASGSFPMSQFFTSGGHSIGVSASASVLPMNIQDWFLLVKPENKSLGFKSAPSSPKTPFLKWPGTQWNLMNQRKMGFDTFLSLCYTIFGVVAVPSTWILEQGDTDRNYMGHTTWVAEEQDWG